MTERPLAHSPVPAASGVGRASLLSTLLTATGLRALRRVLRRRALPAALPLVSLPAPIQDVAAQARDAATELGGALQDAAARIIRVPNEIYGDLVAFFADDPTRDGEDEGDAADRRLSEWGTA